MGKPERGIGQVSDLRLRMSTAPGATAREIARVYAEEGDLGRAAVKLGAKRRTLERLMVDFPILQTAIEGVRSRMGVL